MLLSNTTTHAAMPNEDCRVFGYEANDAWAKLPNLKRHFDVKFDVHSADGLAASKMPPGPSMLS